MENNSFEDILNSITSNEGLMERISNIVKNNKSGEITDTLPQVLAEIAPDLDSSQHNQSAEGIITNSDGNENSAEEKASVATSAGTISRGHTSASSTVLLRALKPYLSRERAEMIDTIIKISQIAELLRLSR